MTANELNTFNMRVSQSGFALGSWNYVTNGLASGYSFNFNFDAATGSFLVGGLSSSSTGQHWNDTVGGSTCPASSVGFSSGSTGQLVCVNDLPLEGSDIPVGKSTLRATPVSPVPLPAAAWLLVSGLGGIGALSRKRRSA